MPRSTPRTKVHPSILLSLAFPWLIATALALAGLVGLVSMGGCELLDRKVDSPFTGKPATSSEIAREAVAAERTARDKAAAEAQAAQDDLRAATRDAAVKAAQVRASAQKSQVQAVADLAILEAETTIAIGRADARLTDATAGLGRALDSIRERTDAAMEQAQARATAMQKVAGLVLDNPVVKTAAASVGIDTGGVTSLLGALGAAGAVGWFNRRAKVLSDAAYDEAAAKEKARAETEKKARDDARRDAELRMISMLTNPQAMAAMLATQPAAAAPSPTGAAST